MEDDSTVSVGSVVSVVSGDSADSSPLVAPPPISMTMHSGNPINVAYLHAQQAIRDANLAFRAAMNAKHLARMAQRAATRAMSSVNALKSSRTRHNGGGSKTRRHKRNPQKK
jgi:hypothetical protein